MLKIFAIGWKDNIVRFSARSELLFFLVLPLVFTFLLGGAGVGGSSQIAILVVDQDQSSLSNQLLTALQSDDNLIMTNVSMEEADKQFENHDASAWLTIPAGFEASLLDGQQAEVNLQKQLDDTSADGAEQAVFAAVSAANRSMAVAHASLLAAEETGNTIDRLAYLTAGLDQADKYFAESPQRVVLTRPEFEGQEQFDEGTQASNGQLITWVFIPLVGISGIFAFERNRKTLNRLVISPTRKATYLMGVLGGQLGAAFVQMSILVLFGIYVMGLYWGNSIGGLALVLITFGLAGAALGVMLGTFIKTEKQAVNLSIMIGMVMALLGGCWWPAELFPSGMQTLAKLIPTYWAMTGLNNLSMRGLGLESVLMPSSILLAFALLFFVVGVFRFRYE